MTSLTDILTAHALDLYNTGRLAEAVAPLIASARLGGGEGAGRIAERLAWDLGAEALSALAQGRTEDAIEWASLGLLIADNIKCLYAFCVIFAGRDPGSTARCARRVDDLAAKADGALRAAALTHLRDALAQSASEATGRAEDLRDLSARVARLRADHPELEAALRLEQDLAREDGSGNRPQRTPSAEASMAVRRLQAHRRAAAFHAAQENIALTAAHCGALQVLAPGDAADEEAFRRLSKAMAELCLTRRAASDESAAQATIGLLVGVTADVSGLSDLMKTLWEQDDRPELTRVASAARQAPASNQPEWAYVAYYCCVADELDSAAERAAIEARACDRFIELSDAFLSRSKGFEAVRFGRTYILLVHRRYAKAREDLFHLIEEMKSDKALEQQFSFQVACSVNYLLQYRNFPNAGYLADVSLANPNADDAFLQELYYFCARSGLTDHAYRTAERLAESHPEWRALRYLREFMRDLDQPPAAMIARPRTGRKVIYANTVCWGSAFVEKMAWGCLTSLAAPRNLPYLARTCDVVFDIVTLRENVEEIMALPEIRLLAECCEIRLYCFPEAPDFKEWIGHLPYVVFGHGQHFTTLRAQRDGADVLLLATDVVLANGSLAFIADHVSDEPRAIFSDGLNCAETPVREALEAYRRDGALSVEPRDLAAIAVRWLKPITYSSFFRTTQQTNKYFVSSVLFRKALGFRTYSFTQNLVYASAAALKRLSGFDHLTCEGRLSELVLENLSPDQIIARRSTDDFLWIELDDADRDWLAPQLSSDQNLLSAITANFMGYTRCLRRMTLFERPVDCHVEGLTHGEIIDDAVEAQFLADLRATMATDPVFTEACRS